ncbi:hypothetical protein GCM10027596_40120 [Nocardioides korecus]
MDPSSQPLRSRTAIVITLALVAAAAVWMLARLGNPSGDPSAGSRHKTLASAAVSSRRSAGKQESPRTAPKGGVLLPEGAEQINDLATGFPDTDLGAVATQVAVSRAQVGFDYDTAITAVRTYAAAGEAAVFEQRARLAVAERRRAAGVLADGGPPAPASYAVTPVAYHLQQLDTEYYAVTLLSYISLTTTDGRSKDGFFAGTQLVKWLQTKSGGDWRITEGTSAEVRKVLDTDRPRPAAPGTDQFESEGWIQLNPEQP